MKVLSPQYHLSMIQELDPLPDLIRREAMTESELEECKRVSSELGTVTSNNQVTGQLASHQSLVIFFRTASIKELLLSTFKFSEQ